MTLSHDMYLELVNQLNKLNAAYYKDTPATSDDNYDTLYAQIKSYENENPLLINPNSPTQTVGTEPEKKFLPHHHQTKMLSLSNAFTDADIDQFLTRVKKETQQHSFDLSIEPKVDGCAVSIIYRNGQLDLAATRGNGQTGELVTHNIKTIQSLPKTIPSTKPIEVRGEVYIKKSIFNSMKHAFANPRNAASGALRQLDPKIAKSRQLDIFIYELVSPQMDTHTNAIDWLKTLGFPVIETHTVSENPIDISKLITHINDNKNSFDFDIDGAVIKVDSRQLQTKMGSTSKAPKWAIAYKFQEETTITTLEHIDFQVGRTGIVTPVAYITPVHLSGAMIKRATLHNFDEIKRLNIHIGDSVTIKRAGEVIPKITGIHQKNPNGIPIEMPTICPSCKEKSIKKIENQVGHQCINPNCPAQIKEKIKHFCSKNAMDIAGLGDAIIEQLLSEKKINSIADLYRLTIDDLINLERFGEKSSKNLLEAINASKTKPFSNVLFALGIPYIGNVSAAIIATHYPTFKYLQDANETDLLSIDQIGPKMATALINTLHSNNYKQLVNDLIKYGITPALPDQPSSQRLAGKVFLITGTLISPRKAIEEQIKKNGGIIANSVSKSLTHLIVGQSAGSKLSKVNELNKKSTNIQIITESELNDFLV